MQPRRKIKQGDTWRRSVEKGLGGRVVTPAIIGERPPKASLKTWTAKSNIEKEKTGLRRAREVSTERRTFYPSYHEIMPPPQSFRVHINPPFI